MSVSMKNIQVMPKTLSSSKNSSRKIKSRSKIYLRMKKFMKYIVH